MSVDFFLTDCIVCAGCGIQSQDLAISIFHILGTKTGIAEWNLRYSI